MTDFTIEDASWQGSFFEAWIRIGPVRVQARLQMHGKVSVNGVDDPHVTMAIARELRTVAGAKLAELWARQDAQDEQEIAKGQTSKATADRINAALKEQAKEGEASPYYVFDSQPPQKKGR